MYPLPSEDLQSKSRDAWHICEGTHNTVARRKTKDDGVCGKDNSCKVFGALVHGFEVHLFSSRAGKHGAKFEPDEEPAEGE